VALGDRISSGHRNTEQRENRVSETGNRAEPLRDLDVTTDKPKFSEFGFAVKRRVATCFFSVRDCPFPGAFLEPKDSESPAKGVEFKKPGDSPAIRLRGETIRRIL